MIIDVDAHSEPPESVISEACRNVRITPLPTPMQNPTGMCHVTWGDRA